MAFLVYNGKFLTRSSKWIGYGSTDPVPVPISGDGIARFRFENTSIDETMLRSLTNNQGTWTQVVDGITGEPIPGMWDYAYNRSASYFRNSFPAGLKYENVGYVDLVDIRDTTAAPSYFWDQAFENDTAIRNANITQLDNSGTMVRMFQDCTNLRSAHIECGAARDAQYLVGDCTGLTSLYISSLNGAGGHAYAGCSSLREITIEITDATNGGYFMAVGHGTDFAGCPYIEEITLIHPSTSVARLTSHGDEYELFNGLAYLKHVNYMKRISDQSSASYGDVEPDLMAVRGDTHRMFYGCASLMALPSLTVSGGILGDCSNMFEGCRQVISGISAAYNVLSAANPGNHNRTFSNCGVDTLQGRAELWTVPVSWGGLAPG